MQLPLVTTIVPVFNRAAMLREAVASVLAQSYRPIEVIIVDDGSTDGTGQAADGLAREHPEDVRTFHQANGGPGIARETGRGHARGEFIQYLDSDDLLLPRKFEVQVEALRQRPECGAAYGWTRYRHPDGRVEPLPWKRSGERIETMFPAMLRSRWWDTPNPLYRASVLEAAGPWTRLRVEEDWEYDCRIASAGVRLAYCEEWVCEVRRHDDHLSGHADAASLASRAEAHLLILEHARRAKIPAAAPEMRHYARELFFLARQCGAVGLEAQSKALLQASRSLHPAFDIAAYSMIARVIGWRRAALAASQLDRWRDSTRT